MTTRASHKRRGKSFETDLVKHLRALGYESERLPLTGALDEGDLTARTPSGLWLIEAKAPGAGNHIDLAGWTRETHTEHAHYCQARGIDPDTVTPLLVIKARGKPLDHAYVVQPLHQVLKKSP